MKTPWQEEIWHNMELRPEMAGGLPGPMTAVSYRLGLGGHTDVGHR